MRVKGGWTLTDPQPMSRKKAVISISLVTALLVALLSLGTWQVERLHWKESLLEQIDARRNAEPVAITEVEKLNGEGGDEEYLRVQLTGRFDHSRERHFFATFNGRTGFYVYTPLQLHDLRYVLVNRGFVPYELKDPTSRAAGQVDGEVMLTGYFRRQLAAKPSWLVPDNDAGKNIFYWKDWGLMVSSVGLQPAQVLPFFIDADENVHVPGGWPQAGVTQFELPNNHLQYAVTWYGLAAALIIVVIAFSRRQNK